MTRIIRAGVAGASALALALLSPVATASAQEGETIITNTETVNVSLDPSGNVDVARVYDQIAIQGSGEVAYTNPVSTEGLRNLDAFGGFTVEEGSVVEDTSVDGQLRRRALSDFDQELPVTVSVVYSLDGQEIDPADLVGKSGSVEVAFRLENMTCAPEEISYDDGLGGEVTETMDVCDPFAGSLSFTLPSNYTDVVSDDGFLPAGDGRGGTLMNLSVAMISGLTDPVQEASYSATVSDAVIPPVTLSFLPLIVEANTSTAPQLAALQGGAETGAELASNGELLDENVLALADGAADLVSGLIQLRDGAGELSAGLVNTAAPGSVELAVGAGDLAAGLNGTAVPGSQQLAAGAGELASGLNGTAVPGSQQLAAGADDLAAGLNGQLLPGADKVAAGLEQVGQGVENLAETVKATPEYKQLLDALNFIISQIGQPSDTDPQATALGALNTIVALSDGGSAAAQQALVDASTGVAKLDCTNDPTTTGCAEFLSIVNLMTDPAAPTQPKPGDLLYSLGAIKQVAQGLSTKLYDTSGGQAGCLQKPPTGCGAAQALGVVALGIGQLVQGIEDTLNSAQLAELVAGGAQLADGVKDAADGSSQVAAGSDQLADGLLDAAGGSNQVADGADQLAAGLVTAADGSNQVADGAGQLADGLGDAADGSVQLSSGLEDAAEAAPALPEGAQRLSAEGTSLLVEAGEDTAQSFGQRVALLEASAERTADGGLPYGGPEDAIVAAAYRYDLSEATGATAQNTGQLLAGVVIAGAAVAGATVLARRKTA